MFNRIPKMAYVFAVALLLLTGCAPASQQTVTVAVHDSFVMSDELVSKFESSTGYKLEIVKLGDAGQLTNKLVLTKDDPIADAFFGIDNTFAPVATERGIVDGEMKQIDYADVCFNYDKEWFNANGIAAPTSWQELNLNVYRGLTVVENPTTSSTGLAFLFATIAKLGDGKWQTWWSNMYANDMKVVAGWENAYYTYFSGSAGKGDYPIVLSYSSSPADELNTDGSSRTASINRDCFRQMEYAGVLHGAKNSAGAQALVAFMLGKDFQSALPASMYVYPVDASVNIPQNWSTFAPPSKSFVDTGKIKLNTMRDIWLDQWSAIKPAG